LKLHKDIHKIKAVPRIEKERAKKMAEKKEEDENKVSIAFGDGDLCFDMEDEQLF
jgi:hypothetical protein